MTDEVKNVQTPSNARKRRFASTNERSAAPGFDKDTLEPSDEAVAERALTAKSSGKKAIRAGAYDQKKKGAAGSHSLEAVPPALSVKRTN